MIGLWTIARRELRAYLASPLGWMVATVFLLVQGYGFYLFLGILSRPDSPHGAVMRLFFGGTLIYWLFLIGVISALTMRLVAGERRSGTLETLLAAPLSETEIILGKYVGAVIFYAALWIPTLVYVALLWALASPSGGHLDLGPIAAGYLGTFLIGASSLALGLLVSTLVSQQVLAALMTFGLLGIFVLLGLFDLLVSTPWLKAVVSYVNLLQQMDDFARGIVDTRVIVFHGSLAAFFLVLSVLALRHRREG